MAVFVCVMLAQSITDAGRHTAAFAGTPGSPTTIGIPFSAWSELTPSLTESPSARRQHASAYDALREHVVVVGGNDGALRNDVWVLSLGFDPEWTRSFPTGAAPTGRRGHSLIYDSLRDRVILFGGYDGNYRRDVWALSLGSSPAWTLLGTAGSAPPVGMYGHSAIYDPVRDQMVVYGGDYGGPSEFADAWALSLDGTPTWSMISPVGAKPPRRALHATAYDPVGERLVIMAGRSGTLNHLSDAWALSLSGTPAWTELTPSGSGFAGREASAAIYDPVERRVVIFGGWSDETGELADVWALKLGANAGLTQLAPAGDLPAPRWGDIVQYDPSVDRMLMFGGSGPYRGDLWELRWFIRPGKVDDGDGIDKNWGTPLAAMPLSIESSYPNPFASSTTLNFSLPATDYARVEVFDVSGRLVRVLANGLSERGYHSAVWDGLDEQSRAVPPGMYFFRLEARSGTATRKVIRM
ncbi:MAG: kelch repeat-containing protein [bacterium]